MPTIPNHRQLEFQLMISRPDGVTWEDLTEYLARAAVEMGDVSAVGTGNTGVDGVARRLEFALRNDGHVVPGLFAWPADGTVAADRTLAADDTVEAGVTDGSWLARLLNQQAFNLRDSFAPRDRLSRWNWWNGQYEPLLDANREVIFRVQTRENATYVQNDAVAVGDGTATVFYTHHAPMVGRFARTKFGQAHRWSDVLGAQTTWADLFTAQDTWVDKLFAPGGEPVEFDLNPETGEVVFAEPLPTGVAMLADYAYWGAVGPWRTEFHGYLGSRIVTNGTTVTCHADDLSKPLRRKFIKESRQYGSPQGTPVEDVIQQILDDYMGAQAPTLYVPVPTGAVISSEPEPWTVEYMSVWDAIQKAAAEIGWWLGYRWVDAAQDYVLTLMEPPTNKSTADFELDWTDDFYAEEEEITDQFVRNDVTVYYRDAEGNRQSVNVQDSDSIAKFGEVSMLIEENNADLIRTQEAALRLANSALHSLAWMTGETRIEMPYLPGLDVFSTIRRRNPQVSSEWDFYAVHSLRVTFDFEAHRYRAECIAAGRVITGRSRWLRMETRPGSPGRPQEPKPPTLGQPGTPLGLTGQFSGLDAIFTWQPSIYRHWQRDKVEVYIGGVLKRTAYVANNVFVYTLDMNREDNGIPSPQVEVRVYHEYTTGALSPPAIVSVSHPVPSAPTVTARSSSAQVRWTVTSEPPVGWKDTIVEAGSLQETVAALAGVIDAQEAGLADGQTATVSVRVRNVFGQMSLPGTAQTTVNYLDKLQFAQDIKPVVLVSTLPQLPNPQYPQGSVVFLTTNNKLYRSTGDEWTTVVDGDDIPEGEIKAHHLAANSVTAGAIAAGAVKADAIDVDELSAISADLGTVTAGILQTPDGRAKFGQNALGSGKHGMLVNDGSNDKVAVGDISGRTWRGQPLPAGTYGVWAPDGFIAVSDFKFETVNDTSGDATSSTSWTPITDFYVDFEVPAGGANVVVWMSAEVAATPQSLPRDDVAAYYCLFLDGIQLIPTIRSVGMTLDSNLIINVEGTIHVRMVIENLSEGMHTLDGRFYARGATPGFGSLAWIFRRSLGVEIFRR